MDVTFETYCIYVHSKAANGSLVFPSGLCYLKWMYSSNVHLRDVAAPLLRLGGQMVLQTI